MWRSGRVRVVTCSSPDHRGLMRKFNQLCYADRPEAIYLTGCCYRSVCHWPGGVGGRGGHAAAGQSTTSIQMLAHHHKSYVRLCVWRCIGEERAFQDRTPGSFFFVFLTVMIKPPDLTERFCELLSITLTSRKDRITALMTRGLILNTLPTPAHTHTHARREPGEVARGQDSSGLGEPH